MVPLAIKWLFMTGKFDGAIKEGMNKQGMTVSYTMVKADAEMLITRKIEPRVVVIVNSISLNSASGSDKKSPGSGNQRLLCRCHFSCLLIFQINFKYSIQHGYPYFFEWGNLSTAETYTALTAREKYNPCRRKLKKQPNVAANGHEEAVGG